MQKIDDKERRCRVPGCNTILRKDNNTGVCSGHPFEIRIRYELPLRVESSGKKSRALKALKEEFSPTQVREIDSSQIEQAESNLDKIREAVMQAYGIELEEFIGTGRSKKFIWSRWLVMYLIRIELELSFLKIGGYFGRTDATVIHGCQRVKQKVASDSLIIEAVQKIREAYLPFLSKPEGCS